jgi:C-terminal processing protease CtpA/Prc
VLRYINHRRVDEDTREGDIDVGGNGVARRNVENDGAATEFEDMEAAQQVQRLQANTVMEAASKCNYVGVGLVITKNMDNNGNEQPYIIVADAFEGYALDTGMRVGDTLISVNGKDVRDAKVEEVGAMLIGEPGSKVVLEYTRPGLDQVQVSSLSRHARVGRLRHHHASPAGGCYTFFDTARKHTNGKIC